MVSREWLYIASNVFAIGEVSETVKDMGQKLEAKSDSFCHETLCAAELPPTGPHRQARYLLPCVPPAAEFDCCPPHRAAPESEKLAQHWDRIFAGSFAPDRSTHSRATAIRDKGEYWSWRRMYRPAP